MVWTGAENIDPTGIRSPDRPARSKSLYRLSYPGHKSVISENKCVVGDVVFQKYYKPCINTRDAACRKPTVITHITESVKCNAANNNNNNNNNNN